MTNLDIFFITLNLKMTLTFLLGHGSRPASILPELSRAMWTPKCSLALCSLLLTKVSHICDIFARSRKKAQTHSRLDYEKFHYWLSYSKNRYLTVWTGSVKANQKWSIFLNLSKLFTWVWLQKVLGAAFKSIIGNIRFGRDMRRWVKK